MLTIYVAQINPTIGDFAGTRKLMAHHIAEAAKARAEVVLFPELSLCGYYPGDLLEVPEFAMEVRLSLREIERASSDYPGLYIVIGAPEDNPGPGKPLFNAMHVVHDGQVVAVHRKVLLPTEGIFDERRHFEPGENLATVLDIKGHRVGLALCEDAWNDGGRAYTENPLQVLESAGAELVLSINASPSHRGKRTLRHEVFGDAAKRHHFAIAYVNQVGGQDSLVFDGSSFAVNASGEVVLEMEPFVEASALWRYNAGRFVADDALEPARWNIGLMEFYRRQIELGLKDYTRRCGFRSVVVGSSGGIDSALTLALAAEALGPENVVAITMPSVFSSVGSVDDSERLCHNLGVKLYRHPIALIVDQFSRQYQETFKKPLQGIPLENLQARIRANILMEYSNAYGPLLLTTGNKSELSVGYSTAFGDAAGGLGLIGDLYKTEVFELCHYLNDSARREIIPIAILTKPPSAELAPGQKDSDSLPPYEILDVILKKLIEGTRLEREEAAEVDSALTQFLEGEAGRLTYNRVLGMIARNEYKRRLSPPLIRVRALAFGTGRQVPIAAHHFYLG